MTAVVRSYQLTVYFYILGALTLGVYLGSSIGCGFTVVGELAQHGEQVSHWI